MRFEFKYLVPMEQYISLKAVMMPFLKRDRFAQQQPNGLYTVRSIYFDTPGFDMYHTTYRPSPAIQGTLPMSWRSHSCLQDDIKAESKNV